MFYKTVKTDCFQAIITPFLHLNVNIIQPCHHITGDLIMTDRTQFEAMLEALINEDQETAQEIFHNIVVAKSREIYEELLSEDFDLEEGENPFAKSEEDGEDKEEDKEEPADDAEGDDAEGEDDDVGGDATDDFIGDVEDDTEDGAEGDMSDNEQTDRIMDLEDALEELKAEFEQLMAGEEAEEHDHPGIHDMGGDDMGDMDTEEDPMAVMEYTKKVSLPTHGDNGANTKSIVAKPNRMGGTSANIAKSFSTEKGGTEGGLLKPSTQPQDGGNINKPGANAGKTAFRKSEPGHGAEKKGAGEKADNKKSLIGGRQ